MTRCAAGICRSYLYPLMWHTQQLIIINTSKYFNLFFSDFAEFFFHIRIRTKDILRSLQHRIGIFKAIATPLAFLYSATIRDCLEASLFFAKQRPH